MILSTTQKAVEYLPSINLDLDNKRLTDFFRRAQDWLVSHIIGTNLENTLEESIEVYQSDNHETLRRLCQRVIAEIALRDAIPELDLQLTEAGFAVQDNDAFSPASQHRVDRLMKTILERIKADIDALVRYLMQNSIAVGGSQPPYGAWRNTEQFKYITSAFMPYWSDFHILQPMLDVSYEEFHGNMAMMAQHMRSVAGYDVGEAEINALLALFRSGEINETQIAVAARLAEVASTAMNNDRMRAMMAAATARRLMLASPEHFSEFVESTAYETPTVSLGTGKTANFL